MLYKTYSSYKASGTDWLGSVPGHWSQCRLKDVGSIFGGSGFPHEYQNKQGEDFYYYKVGDLALSEDGKLLLSSAHTISKTTAQHLNAKIIPSGAIVYAKIGAALMLNRRRVATASCCIDNNMSAFIVTHKSITSDWVFNWLSILDFSIYVKTGTVPSLSEGYQSVLPILVPPISEQRSINSFLNKNTSQFDQLIERKYQFIKLLTEKRTTLAVEAVTGKLNITTGKPYPGYIDSDVQWLGQIPAHWKTKRVKRLFEIKKRISGELGHDVLSITQKGIKIKNITSGEGQLSMDYSKYQFVKIGDFAMNHMDLLTGWVDISKYNGVTSPDYRVFSLTDTHSVSEYLLYVLQMGYSEKILYAFGQGSSHLGRWRLPAEKFKPLKFPCPPKEEQRNISNYIKAEQNRIDMLIDTIKISVDLLKEKRAALITAAVTGKIDIRRGSYVS